ncbi:hypothetical protein F0562_031615 [Nyssa sinensis]|uniref:Uncharacterized protein n=1 Tax=Nyssa sinensis TaxID=561372 RepID=A0A5J5AWV7_9ASTE|nr:hypothetical protein F0562_031615 [Nyssa sinensis]
MAYFYCSYSRAIDEDLGRYLQCHLMESFIATKPELEKQPQYYGKAATKILPKEHPADESNVFHVARSYNINYH